MTRVRTPCIAAITARRRIDPDARTQADEVRALEGFLDELIQADVDFVHIRESDLAHDVLVRVVRGAVAAAARRTTRVIVNERIDAALEAGAAGVHLKATSLGSASGVRARHSGWLIGQSVHSREELARAEGGVAGTLDYVMFGTVFPSASKAGDTPVAGLAALSGIAIATPLPVVAIGGITPALAPDCMRAGASGIAAIGAFLPPGREPGAMGPAAATMAFRISLGEAPGFSERFADPK